MKLAIIIVSIFVSIIILTFLGIIIYTYSVCKKYILDNMNRILDNNKERAE